MKATTANIMQCNILRFMPHNFFVTKFVVSSIQAIAQALAINYNVKNSNSNKPVS